MTMKVKVTMISISSVWICDLILVAGERSSYYYDYFYFLPVINTRKPWQNGIENQIDERRVFLKGNVEYTYSFSFSFFLFHLQGEEK